LSHEIKNHLWVKFSDAGTSNTLFPFSSTVCFPLFAEFNLFFEFSGNIFGRKFHNKNAIILTSLELTTFPSMKKSLLIINVLLVFFGFRLFAENNAGNKITLSGQVKDASNGEDLIGATVYIKDLKMGVVTNSYGFYSISVNPGKYTVVYSYIGYNTVFQALTLQEDYTLNIELALQAKELNEVTITGEKANANVSRPEMSMQKLQMVTIKKIPALMGEVDVIKAIQLLPGVQSTSEGTSGFSVRGGGTDQNLIVLDEATVYNASHLMGFFSVFNNDALRDVKLYKGDIPANFGGRLSSVLEINMKDGNSKKITATGGIGLISSRLTIEGPIVNEKTSFMLSGRRTYYDIFFPLSSDKTIRQSILYFYDLNLKLNHKFDDNNRVFLSAYLGKDKFGLASTYGMGFGNKTLTLRWNHLYSKKLFSNVSAIYSSYNYGLDMSLGGDHYYWDSKLIDYCLKADFNYYATPELNLKFGFASTRHAFDPCNAWINYSQTDSTDRLHLPQSYALEHGIYLSAQQQIGDKITFKYGLRYSLFQNVGTATYYTYGSDYNPKDTLSIKSGKIYNHYWGLEPRLGINYNFNDNSSIKASYSRTIQYVQLASNSTGGMPLDIWFPSSPNIKPQKSDQYAIGYFRNMFDNKIEISVETYYKNMDNVIDYKDHAVLLMNRYLEGEVRTGTAKAYGAEFLIRKPDGKLNGWISYTLSKVKRKIESINDGKEYPAPYDKPNSLNIILNYEISKRVMVSANWIYATGMPATFPVGAFEYQNDYNKIYPSRNGARFPDYHRLDLSVSIKEKEKPKRLWKGEWVFSVYNAYGRHNPWAINFMQDDVNPNIRYAEQIYLFTFFPAVTYNFNF
jgi:hypothetical protein